MRRHADLDFETFKIENWPYPPKPVGVAIWREGERKPKYLAWGHLGGGNNCSKDQAKRELKDIYKTYDLNIHNAPFDLDVGSTHLDLPIPEEFDCTLTLGFLHAPHALSLELKVMADQMLGMKPIEQTRLQEWIFEHFPAAKKKPSSWPEYIAHAPGNIVAPYACGDVRRNRALLRHLRPLVANAGMNDAYRRERDLMSVLIKMTQRGMPVARKKLERDMHAWQREHLELSHAICKKLGGYIYVEDADEYKAAVKTSQNGKKRFLNLDSDQMLAKALDDKGVMSGWLMTPPSRKFPAGQKKVDRDCLKRFMTDKKLYAMLERRGRFSTYINTFALPWLEYSKQDGHLHVIWNGTRRPQGDGGKMGGARTGRLSSSPNLQNVPKRALEGLPHLRRYLVPEEDCNLLIRDYSQQEFRIFAHYEDGAAKDQYNANPYIDFHNMAGDGVNAILTAMSVASLLKLPLHRDIIKALGFGILYGQGLKLTAEKMGVDMKTAKMIRDVYFRVLPGIQPLQHELSDAGKNNEPIHTHGGRVYYVEKPLFAQNRLMTFEYKLLNYLIQGSAADMTKTAMIRADRAGLDIRLSVHDELGVISSVSKTKRNMKLLREAMEDVEGWDVPIRSDGKISRKNWSDLQKYDDERKDYVVTYKEAA